MMIWINLIVLFSLLRLTRCQQRVECIDEANVKSDTHCVVTRIPDRKQDWSTENEKPATKPVSLNVTSACEEFYSDPDYFQSDCDKPMYISWMHYVNSVRNGTVTGFIIEISATEAILFRVNVSKAREYFLTKEFPENELVQFLFTTPPPNKWKHLTHNIIVEPKPTYSSTTEALWVFCALSFQWKIYHCTSDDMVSLPYDDEGRPSGEIDNQNIEEITPETDTSVRVSFYVVSCIFALLLVTGSLWLMKKFLEQRKKKNESLDDTKFMFLLSPLETDDEYKDISNRVVSCLQKNNIKFNLHCSLKRGFEPSWFQMRVEECNHIVLLFTPACDSYLEEKTFQDDSFSAAVSYAKNILLTDSKKRLTVCYFGEVSRKTVPKFLKNFRNFDMVFELDKFVQHLCGKKGKNFSPKSGVNSGRTRLVESSFSCSAPVVSAVNREEIEVFIKHGARPKLKSLKKQC